MICQLKKNKKTQLKLCYQTDGKDYGGKETQKLKKKEGRTKRAYS